MTKFFVHIPGWAYSMTVYGYNKRDAIARFRAENGLDRMPKGYAIWGAS
jgi:hypothetical protein